MIRNLLDVIITFLAAGATFVLIWRLMDRPLGPMRLVAIVASLLVATLVFKKLRQPGKRGG